MSLRRRWAVMAALMGVAAMAVVHGYALGRSPQDDAFISFRYAKNLLEGHGLVFNPGERVEGYTNFLWTMAMVPALAARIDPVEASRALGALCAVATILLIFRFLRDEAPAAAQDAAAGRSFGWIGLGAGVLLASTSSLAAEAVQGLETMLFALLVTSLLLVVEREERRGGGNGLLAGLLGGLGALTRPEGSIILIGSAIHRILPAPVGPGRKLAERSRLVPAMRSVAVCLAIAVPHRLAAWAYYGHPLPNTFYTKVGGGINAIERGVRYAGDFSLAWLPVLAIAFFGLAPLSSSRRWLRAAFVIGYVGYVILVGGDYKWTFRFFAPVMPILALLASSGAAYLAAMIERPLPRRFLACCLVFAAAVSLFWSSAPAREFSRVRRFKYETDRLAGLWFARNLPHDALIATPNAGIIPYFSDLPSLDMLGLTDEHIAHVRMPHMGLGMAGHEKGDGDYVLARKPAVVLFMQSRISTGGPVGVEEAAARISFIAELQLWENHLFREEYEWVSVPLSGYTLNFFRRRTDAAAACPPAARLSAAS